MAVLMLKRWSEPQGSTAACFRNLFRSGLRPNGTSNIAHHRLRRTQRSSPVPIAGRRRTTIHLSLEVDM
jgi:hypothetical protein